ncbi:TadE family protein [Phytohabitans kaempferiae]|uniref:TadE family protein n=1 Tax=Phytohabitans kaempferiae TaxID=1620943 RepID=A0ABV6MA57_9ACTN
MPNDHGSVAVEVALGIPILVLVLLIAAAGLTMARAALDVDTTAAAAARAASLTRDPASAHAAAQHSAAANLAARCDHLTVTVDTSRFARGGSVTVTVACTVAARRLTGTGITGRTTHVATATSPVDFYRGFSLGFTNSEVLAGKDRIGGVQ